MPLQQAVRTDHVDTYNEVPAPAWGAWRAGKARYNRECVFWIDRNDCPGCGRNTNCLHADSSEDEFGPAIICLDCVAEMHRQQDDYTRNKPGQ